MNGRKNNQKWNMSCYSLICGSKKHNKESFYIKHHGINNLQGWVMPKKLPVGGFWLVEETSQFSKDFMKKLK